MNYADLAPIVAIDVLGAPKPLIVRKIAEAANEFYRRTRAYKVWTGPTAVAAATQSLTVTAPDNTALVELESVRIGGRRLTFRTEDQMEGDWEAAAGEPSQYLVRAGAVRLYPIPEVDLVGQARLRFSVAPLVTASAITDTPGLQHQDALIEGAKAKLMSMSDKPWTNERLAGIANAQFERRINEVRILVRNEGSSEVELHVRSRFV